MSSSLRDGGTATTPMPAGSETRRRSGDPSARRWDWPTISHAARSHPDGERRTGAHRVLGRGGERAVRLHFSNS